MVAAQAHAGDAVFFAPPYTRASFEVQYVGPALPLFGAESFAGYYYDRGNPFSQPIDAAALQAQLDRGERAWVVWDRTYVREAPRPASPTVERQDFGSTTLLLVTPAVAAQPQLGASATCPASTGQEAGACKK